MSWSRRKKIPASWSRSKSRKMGRFRKGAGLGVAVSAFPATRASGTAGSVASLSSGLVVPVSATSEILSLPGGTATAGALGASPSELVPVTSSQFSRFAIWELLQLLSEKLSHRPYHLMFHAAPKVIGPINYLKLGRAGERVQICLQVFSLYQLVPASSNDECRRL